MSASKRPVPHPGVLGIDAYVPGRSEAPGAAKVFKLSSNETPLGPSPKAVEAYRAVADQPQLLPRRRRDGAARSHRPRLRPRSRAHRVRRGLGRAVGAPGARVSRARRRGDLHHARLPRVPDRHAGRERQARGGGGEKPHRRRRRHPGGGDAEDARSSSSPIRTIRPARICRCRRCAACTRPCRRTSCSRSTRPMRNTCARTTTSPASSWSRPATTW